MTRHERFSWIRDARFENGYPLTCDACWEYRDPTRPNQMIRPSTRIPPAINTGSSRLRNDTLK
jgi:hypothetical protein